MSYLLRAKLYSVYFEHRSWAGGAGLNRPATRDATILVLRSAYLGTWIFQLAGFQENQVAEIFCLWILSFPDLKVSQI